MRSFNTNFDTAMRVAGHAPVTLMVFRFATGDVCVSDRPVTPSGGPSFEPLVVKWSAIGPPRTGPYGIGLPQSEVELTDESTPAFSSYLASNVPEKTEVDVYEWFEGIGYADREHIGRFVITTPIRQNAGRIRIGLASAFVLRNLKLAPPITTDEFPNADPDGIGESKALVYGSVEGLPCRAIDAGGVARLAGDVTGSDTSIEVSLPADTPGFPDTPFTVQCGPERMRVTSTSGSAWTVTRGYGGTLPQAHKAGRTLYEVRSSYRYLVAGHSVKSIGDVYVDGVRVLSGVTRNTDDSGLATLELDDRLVFEKSVGIDVSDGIGVDDPGHDHGLGQVITKVYGTSDAESKPYNWTTNGNRSAIDDAVEDGDSYQMDANAHSGQGYMKVEFPSWNGPEPVGVKLCCRYMWYTSGTPGSGLYVKLGTSSYGGTSLSLNSPSPSTVKLSNGTSFPSSVYFSMKNNGSAFWADVYEVWLEVTTDATNSSGAGVTKSGTVTLTGDSAADYVVGRNVACDLEGAPDDASGTYTGTPYALIENPADVLKHLLVEHMGMPLSEAGQSFTDARDSLAAAITGGYRLAGAVDEHADAFDVVEDICSQTRLRLLHDGVEASLVFLASPAGGPDKTISAQTVFSGEIYIERAGRAGVINRLTAMYDRDLAKPVGSVKSYRSALESSATYPAGGDADSVADFGPREPSRPVTLGFIRDGDAAGDVRDFTIARYRRPARLVTFTGPVEHLELEYGDVIGFGPGLGAYGLSGTDFVVERVSFLPGGHPSGRPDKVTVSAREVS